MVLWLGEFVAELVGQVLFQVFLLKVARFPVVMVLWMFRSKGRSFNRYWEETRSWELAHGLVGCALMVTLPIAFG